MTSRSAGMSVDAQAEHDAAQLMEFGYRPQLTRALNIWTNFSVGFTYLSPVVGVYSLFAYGLGVGGPAFIWTIPIVVLGQGLVALTFAEISSHYPIAGGIYQWNRRVVGPRYGWFAAWFYVWALLVTIAAVAFAAASFMGPLFGYNVTARSTLVTAVVLIAITGLINLSGVRRMAWVTQLGVIAEIVGTIVFGLIIIIGYRHQSFGSIFHTAGTGAGNYAGAFLAAGLFSAWIFYGFEACGDVAEEVKNPSRKVPRAILSTIGVAAVTVFFITLSYIVGVPSISAVISGKDANPIVTELNGALGYAGTKVALVMVLIAFVSCALSLQAATTRLLFSYGRDGMIVGSHFLSKVSARFHMPLGAVLVCAAVPAIITLLPTATVARIITFGVVGIYVSFQTVVVGSLIGRMKGWKPAGPFRLGQAGWLVNILALVYGVAAIVILSIKTPPAGPSFFDRWLVPISAGIIAAAGLVYLFVFRPKVNVRADASSTGEYGLAESSDGPPSTATASGAG